MQKRGTDLEFIVTLNAYLEELPACYVSDKFSSKVNFKIISDPSSNTKSLSHKQGSMKICICSTLGLKYCTLINSTALLQIISDVTNKQAVITSKIPCLLRE